MTDSNIFSIVLNNRTFSTMTPEMVKARCDGTPYSRWLNSKDVLCRIHNTPNPQDLIFRSNLWFEKDPEFVKLYDICELTYWEMTKNPDDSNAADTAIIALGKLLQKIETLELSKPVGV